MDPFIKITCDLHDLVLQHLSSKETLSISLVSRRWNCEISNSKKCMSKIKFSLKFWKSTGKQEQAEEKIRIMKNVMRKYQHLSIDCRFDRNVSAEFWKLLQFLSPSLKSLKIKSIKHEDPTSVCLQKLEDLKLVYVPIEIRNILLGSSKSFVKLKLKLVSPLNWNRSASKSDQNSFACIKKCLASNEKLKEIELYGSIQYSLFFDEDLKSNTQCSLKSLKIKNDMRLALIPEACEQHLISFLSTQSSSLESIFIQTCRPNVIKYIFNQMTALSSIHIETVMTDYKVKDFNLRLNEHVIDLRIPYITRNQDIRDMLEMTPNVVSLFVAHLSHETMEYIAFNLKKLRSLKYRYDEIDCETLYEQLREQNAEVNQDIEMIVDYDYT